MNVELHFIYGMMFGFELLEKEQLEEIGASTGFVIDLGIVRLVCLK